VLIGLAAWAAVAYRNYRRWNQYVQALRAEPGIVVISSGRSDGKYTVTGLRDPLARDPGTLLPQTQLSPNDVAGHWQPYQALLPSFVLSRANSVLNPPTGTTLTFQDGVLRADGDAPAAWLADARRLAPLIAGVNSFDGSAALRARTQSMTRQLQQATLLFDRGTSRLRPGQEGQLRATAAIVTELGLLAAASGHAVRIDVIGHTDADGSMQSNVPLSIARAQQAILALRLPSSDYVTLQPSGVGSDDPRVPGVTEDEKQQNRRIAFRVSQIPGGPEESARR
jgi:outer membrane protein OmpA-like peptidoglycan-associated protein